MSRRHPVPKNNRLDNAFGAGLGDLAAMVRVGSLITGGSDLSAYNTIGYSNNYSLITLNRIVLTYLFTTNGLFQTALQLPIQDAIFKGIELICDEISAADIDTVLEFWDDEGIWDTVLNGATWARLYGGGGIVINTNQDPETPLRLRNIGRSPLELYDVERWQLDSNFPYTEEFEYQGKQGEFMYLLGKKIHESRFILMKGKRAPSYVRRQLRGWGMSEGERMIRELNIYLKTQDVLYQILDESKIDVYSIKGLAQKLMTAGGTSAIATRVQLANQLKSYVSALVLDSEEKFEQKTMTFAGLAEVSKENRIGVAATLRMPVTKLFGMSAAGFSSGEEDLESYNQMVESEIRRPLNRTIKGLFDLTFAYLFDYVPKYRFKWPTMRVLTETEHQEVLTAENNRILSWYDRGLMTSQIAEDEAKKKGIFTSDIKVPLKPVPPNGPESVPGEAPPIKANQKGFFNSDDFDESKHPRADDGKFGSGGGGKSESRRPELEETYEERYQKASAKHEKSSDRLKRDQTAYKESLSKYPNIKKTTIDQKKAIKQYTGDDYRKINDYARNGGSNPEYQQILDQCSEFIESNKLVEKITIFRGISMNLQIEPGDQLPVKGIASFSSSDTVAVTFTSFRDDSSIMEIAGKPGDPMAPVNGYSTSGGYKEAEYIMKPGTNLQCVGKKKVGRYTVYTMEIVL